jgi:hypothetical protein
MKTSCGIAILSIAIAATACDEQHEVVAPTAHVSPAVTTDSAAYTLRKVAGGYDAVAHAVYVNRTGGPVYYARCDPRSTGPMYGLRRVVPDTGFSFVGGAWACVGGVPTGMLSAGDSITVDVWLGSTDSPAAQPPITMGQRIGRFKILLELCDRPLADSDDCKLVGEDARSSNEFDLKPPS